MITPTVCRRFYWQELPDPIIVALCVLISLFIALVNWPGTSMSQRVAQVTIILLEVAVEIYAIGHRLKFLRLATRI
jgi:hypothetical protein